MATRISMNEAVAAVLELTEHFKANDVGNFQQDVGVAATDVLNFGAQVFLKNTAAPNPTPILGPNPLEKKALIENLKVMHQEGTRWKSRAQAPSGEYGSWLSLILDKLLEGVRAWLATLGIII